ncbi:hypothetical protein LSTR_LSTR008275 [Laodelphax striatellus]|uniref:H/ACA ribonucleoprotein complex subunit 2 n=1 Tax=Laodelphax striatellus TaxID=195883 RepID=A0A482XKS6_LAOST|nr:hypothetical protein LSTR_LSTR008275 [Laodelphax striatellus]
MEDVTIKQEPMDAEEMNGANVSIRDLSYDAKLKFVNAIAKPMADKKMSKKLLKLLKKAKSHSSKDSVRHSLKDVQRRLLRKEKGIVVLAGNVSPIDLYTHFPILCEENNVPYCFVPTRDDLGQAMGFSHMGPVCVLIKPEADYQELYDECWEKLKLLPTPV